MYPSQPNNITPKEPKETISARIPTSLKRDFELEAQRMGKTPSELIEELVANREIYFGIKHFEGVLIDIPLKTRNILQAYCLQNDVEATPYLLEVIIDHVNQLFSTVPSTHTSILENGKNGVQNTGLQALANVNNDVNSRVDGHLQAYAEKTPYFVNREKRLNDAIQNLLLELNYGKMFSNSLKVVNHAVENSGMIKKQLSRNDLLKILLDGFSAEEIKVLEQL